MPHERIDIVVPDAVLLRNREKQSLLGAAAKLQKPPRVPVLIDVSQWCIQEVRGSRVGEFLAGPRENLRCQLLNLKWRAENVSVLDDTPIPTESVTLQPNLGSPRGTEFPMKWDWPEDQPLKCRHLLSEPEQIDNLAVPEPDGGLNALIIDWYRQMRRMAEEFELRVNGQPVAIHISVSHGGGPIPAAFALAGENLFYWMAAEPDRAHRLMELVTESDLRCRDYFDDLAGRPRGGEIWMGADSAEMISAEMYREFVVPYCRKVWARHSGRRVLHMCGRIDHLLDVLRDDMAITELNGFGFPTSPERLAAAMAGRVVLIGGPSPMILLDGPVEAIQQQTRRYVRCLGGRGGYICQLGGAMTLGTPLRHIAAMVDAAASESGTM